MIVTATNVNVYLEPAAELAGKPLA